MAVLFYDILRREDTYANLIGGGVTVNQRQVYICNDLTVDNKYVLGFYGGDANEYWAFTLDLNMNPNHYLGDGGIEYYKVAHGDIEVIRIRSGVNTAKLGWMELTGVIPAGGTVGGFETTYGFYIDHNVANIGYFVGDPEAAAPAKSGQFWYSSANARVELNCLRRADLWIESADYLGVRGDLTFTFENINLISDTTIIFNPASGVRLNDQKPLWFYGAAVLRGGIQGSDAFGMWIWAGQDGDMVIESLPTGAPARGDLTMNFDTYNFNAAAPGTAFNFSGANIVIKLGANIIFQDGGANQRGQIYGDLGNTAFIIEAQSAGDMRIESQISGTRGNLELRFEDIIIKDGTFRFDSANDRAFFGFAKATIITIAAGVATPTQVNHEIAAQAGITDDLDAIDTTNSLEGDILILRADTGDTITVTDWDTDVTTVNKISCGIDRDLTGTAVMVLICSKHDGATLMWDMVSFEDNVTNHIQADIFGFGAYTLQTVTAGGAIVPTSGYVNVTGNGSAADDLITIDATNFKNGDIIILRNAIDSGAASITVKDGTDNIQCGGDRVLSHKVDRMILMLDGILNTWCELSFADNA